MDLYLSILRDKYEANLTAIDGNVASITATGCRWVVNYYMHPDDPSDSYDLANYYTVLSTRPPGSVMGE